MADRNKNSYEQVKKKPNNLDVQAPWNKTVGIFKQTKEINRWRILTRKKKLVGKLKPFTTNKTQDSESEIKQSFYQTHAIFSDFLSNQTEFR